MWLLIEKIKRRFRKRTIFMKLTMRAITRWEQLNRKSFYKINYSDEDDIITLFYTCTQSNTINISLDDFKKSLTHKSSIAMIREFERQTSLISQFQEVPKEKDNDKGKDTEATEPPYIKDIVAKLVMNGLDVHFALNDMQLCDLPIYLEAYDQNIKNRLETQRLGIFWILRPHVSDKIKTPKDLYELPWEEKKEEMITKEQWEEAELIVKSMKRD